MYINLNQMLHCPDECYFILCRFVPLNRDKPSVLCCVPLDSVWFLPNFYWIFYFFVQHSATEYSLLYVTVSMLVCVPGIGNAVVSLCCFL